MKKLLSLLFVILFSVSVFSQKSVKALNPAHAAALEQFISKNKDYKFLSENVLDSEYLNDMRKFLSKSLTPYYRIGDFNGDKIQDFAMILSKVGEVEDQGEGFAETHRYNHPLAVVIFNGQKNGGFKQIFLEDIKVPLACFLNVDKELYFAVFESDADTMIFTPAGKGYIVEFPDEP